MNVNKPWLIVFVLAAGAASFWFFDDAPQEQERVTNQTESEQSTYRPDDPSRPANSLPDRTGREREGRNYRSPPVSQYGMPHQTFAPPAGSARFSSPQEGYRFRTQEGQTETGTDRQAYSYETAPAWQGYPSETAPAWQGYTEAPRNIGRSDLEPSYRLQGPANTGYRFRPQDSAGRSQRWTGNYSQVPGSRPQAPMTPNTHQSPGQYPSPWQQSGPKPGSNPLWADTWGQP